MTPHKLYRPEDYLQLKEKVRYAEAMRNQAHATKLPDAAIYDKMVTKYTLQLQSMQKTRSVFHGRHHNTTSV